MSLEPDTEARPPEPARGTRVLVPETPRAPARPFVADQSAWPTMSVFGPTFENPVERDRWTSEDQHALVLDAVAAVFREAFDAELDRLLDGPLAAAASAPPTESVVPVPAPAVAGGRRSWREWNLMLRAAAVGAVLAFAASSALGVIWRDNATPVLRPSPANAGLAEAMAATPVTLVPPAAAVAKLLAEPDVSVVAAAAVASVRVRDEPGGSVTHELANPTENGGPLVFLVREERDGWLRVDLPVRPNGSTGWIRLDQAKLSTNTYRITVSRGERIFRLYDADELVMERPVAIGKTDTPTPGGKFYIKELLQPPNPHTIYGPFAFGLSGFSNALTEFNGGEGVIGIHGTNDESSIGNEVSSGCIRLHNEDITKLAGMLPLGTPVEILE